MSSKSPAFQIYVNDFLGSAKVAMMDGTQIGIYMMLLFLDWQECGFVFESVSLSRWCRVSQEEFDRAWPIISQCFKSKRGRMFNPRMELEREKQQKWREKSAKGGRSTAERWLNGGTTVVQAQPSTPFPFPLPITTTPISPKDGDSGSGYPADFELLWKAYPKREGPNNKRSSFKAFTARLKSGVSYDVMFEGVKRYREYLNATGKEGTAYVKMAATFLGPDRHFADDWAVPDQKPEPEQQRKVSGVIPISRGPIQW